MKQMLLRGLLMILCSLGLSGCMTSAYLVSQAFYAADDVRLETYENALKDAPLSDLINIYTNLAFTDEHDKHGDLAKQFGFVSDKDLYFIVRAELGKRFEYGMDVLHEDYACALHFYNRSDIYDGGSDMPIHWFGPSKAGLQRLKAQGQKDEPFDTFNGEDARCLTLLHEAAGKQ